MSATDATHAEHAAGEHEHHDHHVCDAKTFAGILVALLFLTFVTVWVSRFDFGSANMLIAMLVAGVKACLVMGVFMHLIWDTAVNKLFFLCSFLFLGLLFLFSFADLTGRVPTPDQARFFLETRGQTLEEALATADAGRPREAVDVLSMSAPEAETSATEDTMPSRRRSVCAARPSISLKRLRATHLRTSSLTAP